MTAPGCYECMGCGGSTPTAGWCQDCTRWGAESARPTFQAEPSRVAQALLTSPYRNRIDGATIHLRPDDLLNAQVVEWIRLVIVPRLRAHATITIVLAP